MDIDQPPQNNEPKKKYAQIKIVGFNLLAVAFYGLLCNAVPNSDGLIYYLFLIAIHFLFCICAAIYKRNWMWVLSGIMVLVIGFSTCVSSFNI